MFLTRLNFAETHVGDDTMERRALVAKTVRTDSELTEVPCRLGDDIVEQFESDTTGRRAVDGDIELW